MNCSKLTPAALKIHKVPCICVAAALLLSSSGCVIDSVNPWYTEKDVIEEAVLVGDWQDGLTITSLGNKTYKRTNPKLNPADKPSKFRILKLGTHTLIDLENANGTHTFARISVLGDTLYVRTLTEDWLKEHLRKYPKEIAHRIDRVPEKIYGDYRDLPPPGMQPRTVERLILTAETRDLQSFVMKFIDDPLAFGGKPSPYDRKVAGIPIKDSGLASKKYRTYNYWYEVRMALYGLSVPKGTKPEVAAEKLEGLSKAIEELPTLGVDREAAECANDAAKLLASMAAVIRDNNDGGRMFEAFVRGAMGDPFGVAKEQLDAQKQTKQLLANCVDRFSKARILLTDRYEIEFLQIK